MKHKIIVNNNSNLVLNKKFGVFFLFYIQIH